MKLYLSLVLALCLLVACSGEPTATPMPAAPSTGDAWTRPTDGAAMVFVSAGEFLMGSSDDDPDAEPTEKPQHAVYLDAFWIDQNEVTYDQYRRCVEAGTCEEPGCWGDSSDSTAPEQPVVCVSWSDAQDYAVWVGGRLPTEAEWEKAARGTDGRFYPWGNSPPDCDQANHGDCAGKPLPVGSHLDAVSPYGALDMAGNVREWVADWYDGEYYSRSPSQNPQGPELEEIPHRYRALRGGAFDGEAMRVRCASRGGLIPGNPYDNVGFRVVVDPGPSEP